MFSCGYDSLPFELGVFCAQEEAKKAFGAPAARVKGRVRKMSGTLSGGTAASMRAIVEATMRDLSLVTMLRDPFVLTPGFDGPKQPLGNRPVFDEDLKSWTAPFVMANINTRNVHRSNMLLDFPYGKDFVYDEMVMTGPGEQGEAIAKKVMAANNKFSGAEVPKPGEGPSKEERENGMLRSPVRRHRARRPPGPRRSQGRPRSRLRFDLEDDLGMRDLPAARCAGGSGRDLDSGCGDGRQTDKAAGRSRRADVRGGEVGPSPLPARAGRGDVERCGASACYGA